METINNLPIPPWDMDNAAERLQLLENDYNSLDVERISANFATDAEVRFGTQFIKGRTEILKYLTTDLSGKSAFYIGLDLWGALKTRMAVRSESKWIDENNNPIKSYGVLVFQFNEEGLIELNYSSFNGFKTSS